MIKIYRKTATIQAEQFDGSPEMIAKYDVIDSEGAGLFLPTLEGNLEFHVNDWIATGVKGEHWAIADDVFKRTYAELPDADHEALLDTLVNFKGKVILSGYPSSMYDSYLVGWHKRYFDAHAEAGHKRREVVWCNFEPAGSLDLLEMEDAKHD